MAQQWSEEQHARTDRSARHRIVTTLTARQALAAATHQHALAQPGSSIEEIAEDLIGLHNTSQTTPYLSVRARLPGFQRPELETLMWDEWRLVRARAMRLTMFIFPRDLLEIAVAATRGIGESLADRWLRDSKLSRAEFDRLAGEVERALRDGPHTVRELRRLLDVAASVDLPGVVGRLCDQGVLAGGAPPRSWRSTIRQYHRWEDVLADLDPHRGDEERAVRELIGRYVRSYGPVTVSDMAWWTGLTKQRCRVALDVLDVEEVTVEGWPGPLYRLPCSDAPGDPGRAVHALPLLDPYVQGYRDRVRLLDPDRHDFVWDGGGNATATLVQGGRIIGVWQTAEEPVESVRYHLFGGGPATVRKAAETDLVAAGEFYFDRPVDVVEIPEMLPLSAGGGRSASHPLNDRLHRPSRRGRA